MTPPRTSHRPSRSEYDRSTWSEQPPTTAGLGLSVGLPYKHCNSTQHGNYTQCQPLPSVLEVCIAFSQQT